MTFEKYLVTVFLMSPPKSLTFDFGTKMLPTWIEIVTIYKKWYWELFKRNKLNIVISLKKYIIMLHYNVLMRSSEVYELWRICKRNLVYS